MNLFKNVRLNLALNILKKEIKRKRYKHQTIAFKDATQIGLLFNVTSTDDFTQIQEFVSFLKDNAKKVHVIGFIPQGELTTYLLKSSEIDYLTNDHLNWLYIPKKERIQKFTDRPLDILINLSPKMYFPLNYIAAKTRAKFKIGQYDKQATFCYDFMIDNKNNPSLSEFIHQIKHYLLLINNEQTPL